MVIIDERWLRRLQIRRLTSLPYDERLGVELSAQPAALGHWARTSERPRDQDSLDQHDYHRSVPKHTDPQTQTLVVMNTGTLDGHSEKQRR
jgi:hypothetical protein